MRFWEKALSAVFAVILGIAFVGCAKPSDGSKPSEKVDPKPYVITQADTVNSLSATDAFGRTFSPVNGMNPSKKVGMFYFVWQGNIGSASVDNSKTDLAVLEGNSDINVHHYWGEPLYGYYHAEDPWVMTKHIELFIMAGIDYLCLDTTNNLPSTQSYETAVKNLLETLLKFRNQGFTVPQVMFYTNTSSGATVQYLYNTFYDAQSKPRLAKYEPLWFTFEDTNNKNAQKKPWIVANDEYLALEDKVKNFFYRKESQWPNEYNASGDFVNKDNGFPWMSWAKNGRQYNHDGIMSVSIAQHISGVFSDSVMLGDKNVNRGRGFSLLHGVNDNGLVRQGSNFQEQWDYAVMQGDKVNNVFITGWNEWVAQKQPANSASGGKSYFVDCFNEEFSRDAEMMKDGYGDAFYLQMCDNIRRFKGVADDKESKNPASATIDITGGLTQWEYAIGFSDATGDMQARNYKSANYSLPNYTSEAGRNDIDYVRFTYDDDNLYFLIVCKSQVQPYDEKSNWMNILLGIDGANGESWENYHYVINRTVADGTSSVERLKSDGTGISAGEANLFVNGKTVAVSVPRAAVGLTGKTFKIGFKVADSVENPTDIADYYIHGDCAPIGRLNYTVEVK